MIPVAKIKRYRLSLGYVNIDNQKLFYSLDMWMLIFVWWRVAVWLPLFKSSIMHNRMSNRPQEKRIRGHKASIETISEQTMIVTSQ